MSNAPAPQSQARIYSAGHISGDIPGTITKQIGSGKHAQAAIAWQTIKWSFIAGGAVSVLIVAVPTIAGTTAELVHVIEVWKIFMPLITLVLGYVFGKGTV